MSFVAAGKSAGRWRLSLIVAMVAAWPLMARAGGAPPGFSCSFSVTDMDFGNVNVLTGTGLTTVGQIQINCTNGNAYDYVTICPNIEYGSGNPTAWNPRQMANTANFSQKLNYNLYHPGTTNIWGSLYWAHSARPPILRFRLDASGRGTWTYSIDARIPAGQSSVVPGLYTSSFAGNDVLFEYSYGSWSSCFFLDGYERPPFQVRANVIAFCEVSATDLDFGTTGLLNGNVDSTGQISVRCTNGTPYEVRLNGGLAGATSPDQRRMFKGGESIRYGIYRNSTRTLGWGNTTATAVSGTGTGNVQNYTTYGRVFPQATPSAGTYTDTVVVTVVY